MTKEDISKFIEKNLRTSSNSMIATDAGLEAARRLGVRAEKDNIEWALVGGIAMHLYGSPRLTKDVDVIASAVLNLESSKNLGFGGKRYTVKIENLEVRVDWIVRGDAARKFYESALKEAHKTTSGFPIVTPEWMVILKYIAGRFKDQQDAVYLLKQKKLVDRRLVRRKIVETANGEYWALAAAGLQRWYDLADGKITTEKEDYEAGKL